VRNIHAIILAACVTVAASSAYAQQAAVATQSPSAAQYKNSNNPAETDALAFMARGDNWTGTNALKAIVAKNNTPLNRFNLATGYQRTGRVDQARSLYQGLLTGGRNTNAVAAPYKGLGGARTFNVATESASRLLYIQWLKDEGARKAATRKSASAPAADAVGMDASANVGGPSSGDVSDEKAMALDGLAQTGAAQ
jgi:hypothetical protein